MFTTDTLTHSTMLCFQGLVGTYIPLVVVMMITLMMITLMMITLMMITLMMITLMMTLGVLGTQSPRYLGYRRYK